MMHAIRSTGRQYYKGVQVKKVTLLPPFVLPLAVLVFLFFGFGPNWLVATASLLCLLVICALLWRPGETPILLFVFIYQWLEASINIFYANWQEQPLEVFAMQGIDVLESTVLSLIGLLAMSTGVWYALRRKLLVNGDLIQRQVHQMSRSKLLGFYLITSAIGIVAVSLATFFSGLSQLLLVLSALKWTAFIILTYHNFLKNDVSKNLWYLIFLFELFLSLGSFFSSFKFVFITAFLGIVGASVKLELKKTILISFFVSIAIFFGVIWTSIKSDYRSYVNKGTNTQTVIVSYNEQLSFLGDLISSVNSESIKLASEALISRISYVDFFGAAIKYVPQVVPHSNGALWFEAVTRPFMPRLFFPNKEIIDESEKVNKYTGLAVAGFDQGTQISIGYMGDSYIDFGKYLMMPFLLVLGWVLGQCYKWLLNGKYSSGILGSAQAGAILMSVSIGTSSPKLFGGIFVSLLVIWAFNRFVVTRYLPWLVASPKLRRS